MDIDLNLRFFSYRKRISLRKSWIRFGIIFLVILVTFVMTYWGAIRIQTLVLFVLAGIGSSIVLLKQPNLVYVLIFFGGAFVPYSGPGGINAVVLFVSLLIAIWLMDMLVVRREFKLNKSRVILPLLLLLMISVIAFGMGQVPWFVFANQAPIDSQLGGFAIYTLSLGCMLATAHLIKDIKWLKFIVWVFIGIGGVNLIGRLIDVPVSNLYHRGFLGSMLWTWLTALIFAQAFYNTDLKAPARFFLYSILIVLFIVAFVQTYSWKSGWIPPLVAIAVLLAIKYRRIAVLAIPIGLIVVAYLSQDLISSDEYSWGTRVDAWQIVLEISKVNPLFGLGFSNYYWYTPLYSIRGWYVNFNSHSQFVDLIAQVGILGLFCFLWVFFEVIRLSWRLIQGKLLEGFSEAYVYAVLAGAIATLAAASLGDWVLPFVYNVGLTGFRASILPWIFLGGLIAIEKITGEKDFAKTTSID